MRQGQLYQDSALDTPPSGVVVRPLHLRLRGLLGVLLADGLQNRPTVERERARTGRGASREFQRNREMLASRVFYAVAERFCRENADAYSRFAVSWWGVETAKRQNRQP